jgi:hypothetical protein
MLRLVTLPNLLPLHERESDELHKGNVFTYGRFWHGYQTWSTKRYLNIELLNDQQMRGAITA